MKHILVSISGREEESKGMSSPRSYEMRFSRLLSGG